MSWLSGYSYRKKVTISGSSGAGENYQVKLSIGSSSGGDLHLEGHCEDFPNDIRFTDDDGATLLDYWIEDPTQDPITVWIKVKDNLDNNVDIYIYYGNPSASSASDGDATFEFFDDFTGKSINAKFLTNWTKSPNNPLQDKTCQNWFIAVYSNYNNEDRIYIFEQREEGSNTIECWSFKREDADNPSNWTDHGIVYTATGAHENGHIEPHGIIFETQAMADARTGVPNSERMWRLYYCAKGDGEASDKYSVNFAVAPESDLTNWTAYEGNPVYDHDAEWGYADCKVCIYNNQVWMHHCKYKPGTYCNPAFFSYSDNGIDNWTDVMDKNWYDERTVAGTLIPFDTGILLTGNPLPDDTYNAYFTTDGINKITYSNNPILSHGASGQWDDSDLEWCTIVVDKNGNPNLNGAGTYYLFYMGNDGSTHRLGLATSNTIEEQTAYVLDEEKWNKNAVNSITYTLNNYFRFEDAAKSDGNHWIYDGTDTGSQHQAKWTPLTNFIVEWKNSINSLNNNEMGEGGISIVASDNTVIVYLGHMDGDGFAISVQRFAITEASWSSIDTGYTLHSWGSGTDNLVKKNSNTGDSVIFKIKKSGNSVSVWEDNTKIADTTISSSVSKLSLTAGAYGGYPYLDYVQIKNLRVRKYADPEPSFSSAQAEEGPVFTCGDTLANLSGSQWAIYGSSSDILNSSSASSVHREIFPVCLETLNCSDALSSILSLISHSQDSLGLIDSNISSAILLLNAIDSIDVSDGCTLSFSFTSSCLDVLHAIDSTSYPLPNVVSCLDSLGAQDSISSLLSMLCQSKDNIGGADGETSQLSVERALLDILAFQDTSSYLTGIIASASDILNVQDLNSVRLTFSCSSIDIVKNVDSEGVNVTFHLDGNDILKGADFVSGNLQVLLDSLSVFKSTDQSASSLLGFILRSATDVLDMYDLNTTTLQISSSSIDIFRSEDNSSINITLHLNSADIFKNSDSAILSLQALLSALETLKVSDSSAASLFAEILASASDLLATSDYNGVRLEFLNSSIDVIKSEDRATPSITLHLNSSDILHGLDSVTTKLEAILRAVSEFKGTDRSSTRRQIVHITPVKIFKAQQKILVFKAENI